MSNRFFEGAPVEILAHVPHGVKRLVVLYFPPGWADPDDEERYELMSEHQYESLGIRAVERETVA